MRGFFRFFAERHMLANLFTISAIVLGVSTLTHIKRDQYPNVDIGQMVVTTLYPGASPEDVELNVTNKIEDELKEVTGISKIMSVSMENVSSIVIHIDFDVVDTDAVKDDIRRAVGRVSGFPDAVTESPFILDIKTPFEPFIEVGVSGDIDYEKLRKYSHIIEKKLGAITGVHRLERFGYTAREVKVEVDPDAMRKYQIPLREIMRAIQTRNVRGAGGSLESYTSEKNVVTLAQFRNIKEVGDVIVRSTFDGPALKVKDLAVVIDGHEDETTISRLNGKAGISFAVFNKSTADVIRTVAKVKKFIDEEKKFAPDGVTIHYGNDISSAVRNQFKIVITNGAIGLSLVMVILTLLLNLRTAFWVSVGIPVAFLGVVFLLPAFGAFLDTLVLTALVIVIGIIVDDAIIVSESIYRRLEKGDKPVDAAVNGLMAVYKPVITTMLSTFVAFAPMFFMPGMMGKFVFVIPLAVSLALFISLAEIVISLPAHLIVTKKRGEGKKAEEVVADRGSKWFHALEDRFVKMVKIPIRFRYLTALIFLFVFASSLFYASKYMGFVLFPTKGAERFIIAIETPMGNSLSATSDIVTKVEKILDTLPKNELESYSSRTGMLMKEAEAPQNGERYGSIPVLLTPWSKRTRTADEIVEVLRNKIEGIEGIEKVSFSVMAGGPPAGKPITIRVIGADDKIRAKLTNDVEAFLTKIDGVKDLTRDDDPGKDQVEIKIDYDKLARLGLTVADVAQNVRVAYDGEVVTSVRYGEDDVDFRVILQEKARKNVKYLKNLTVPNNRGRLIKLSEVAKFVTEPGPNDVHHFDRERTTTIFGDVDLDITTPLAVSGAVAKNFKLDVDYPGMRFQIGGEAQETAESMQGLFIAFIMAAIGMYFLLTLLFNSFFQPFIVLLAIPFGLAGVIIAFALHGESFGFLAILGVVGMAGVVVNDSLVLVDHLNQLMKERTDESVLSIVARGTADRLRAILMTSATTVVGLLPLAYGVGGADLYMGPMALALGYGILFATPLTLVLVPAYYLIANDIADLFGRKMA